MARADILMAHRPSIPFSPSPSIPFPSPLLSSPDAAAPPPRRRPDAATPPRRRETPRRRRPAAFPTEKEEEEGALAVDLARPTPVARPTRHRPAALVAGGPDATPSTPPSPEHPHHHPDLVAPVSSPSSSPPIPLASPVSPHLYFFLSPAPPPPVAILPHLGSMLLVFHVCWQSDKCHCIIWSNIAT